MVYWTIQPQSVVEKVLQDGYYEADYNKSEYLDTSKELRSVYDNLLTYANTLNKSKLDGLVDAFVGVDSKTGEHILTDEDFVLWMERNKAALGGHWRYLKKNKERMFLIKLVDRPEFWNPLILDFNDWSFLLPPVMALPPYQAEDISRISQLLAQGLVPENIFPSGAYQARLPYIDKSVVENIVDITDVLQVF